MIRRLLTLPYRVWLRSDLKWINDLIADEKDRQRLHEPTLRSLEAQRSEIIAKLGDDRPAHSLSALWPHDTSSESAP